MPAEITRELIADRLERVTSAMIRSASVRWDLRVETYETENELMAKLPRFAGGIMHCERRGELDRQE